RGVQGPAFLDAPEAMLAALLEPYSGPGDEIFHRARHPDFTGIGQPRYARADMDADPGYVGAAGLDLRRVDAAAHIEAGGPGDVADRAAAAHGAARSVEGRDQAVACRAERGAGNPIDLRSGGAGEAAQRGRPPPIGERDRLAGRFDDVDEKNGGQHAAAGVDALMPRDEGLDGVENLVGVDRDEVVLACQLDEPCAADALGDVASFLDIRIAIVAAVENEGRPANRGQD